MISKIKEWIRKSRSVPLYIGGMCPADPQFADSGTTVALSDPKTKEMLELGRSDENGEFYGRIPRRYIGKKLFFPARHAGFLYDHEYQMIVQPWGLFNAIKMTPDRNYNGRKKSPKDDEFAERATQEYLKADAKAQYLARNQINRTNWFWMASGLGLISALVASGLNPWASFALPVAVIGLRAYLTKRAIGLSEDPRH